MLTGLVVLRLVVPYMATPSLLREISFFGVPRNNLLLLAQAVNQNMANAASEIVWVTNLLHELWTSSF